MEAVSPLITVEVNHRKIHLITTPVSKTEQFLRLIQKCVILGFAESHILSLRKE